MFPVFFWCQLRLFIVIIGSELTEVFTAIDGDENASACGFTKIFKSLKVFR